MRERWARWTRQSAQLAALSLLLVVGSLCLASQALAQTACETTPATIERTALTEQTPAGVGLEAEIDPHNGETTYEFAVVWRVLDPSERGERVPGDPRVQGGAIPAGAGAVTVSGFVPALQPGYTYWYEVIASNLAGKTKSAAQWFSYYYTGGYPYGLGGGPPDESEVSPCSLESAQREAEAIYQEAEARRRQHAREAQEQLAGEVAARYASEAAALKHREEEMAAAEVAIHVPSCVVPALRGHTLSAARRALEQAHCRIGEVRRPDHHRGELVIVGQAIRHGKRLAGGTAIAVTMGAQRVSARPAHVQ